MPRTTIVTKPDWTLEFFDKGAAEKVKEGLQKGWKVEKVESVFGDPGDDYVQFRVAGRIVAHLPGY